MVTRDELHAMALKSALNLDVTKEAFTQSEKRLSDVLDGKKVIEQKAQALFSAYVTLAVALLGVGAALFRDAAFRPVAWTFFAAGVALIVGGLALVFSQRGAKYGYLGVGPNVWLQDGTINGGDQALPLVLAAAVLEHEERIADSLASNRQKRTAFYVGMGLGLAAAIILAGGLLVAWASSS